MEQEAISLPKSFIVLELSPVSDHPPKSKARVLMPTGKNNHSECFYFQGITARNNNYLSITRRSRPLRKGRKEGKSK